MASTRRMFSCDLTLSDFHLGFGFGGFSFQGIVCFFRLEIFVLDFCFTASMLFCFSLLTCSLFFCVFLLFFSASLLLCFCFSLLFLPKRSSAFPCFYAYLLFLASSLMSFSMKAIYQVCQGLVQGLLRFGLRSIQGRFRIY